MVDRASTDEHTNSPRAHMAHTSEVRRIHRRGGRIHRRGGRIYRWDTATPTSMTNPRKGSLVTRW
eukprot:202369-Pyramimonas_sp.AAC.1